jgi:hypothetical protein
MTYATMNKGLTMFVSLPCGATLVEVADTIAESAALMTKHFGPAHPVKFTLTEAEGIPSVEQQLKNRIRKLKQIALLAGRVVTRVERNGLQVSALVRS